MHQLWNVLTGGEEESVGEGQEDVGRGGRLCDRCQQRVPYSNFELHQARCGRLTPSRLTGSRPPTFPPARQSTPCREPTTPDVPAGGTTASSMASQDRSREGLRRCSKCGNKIPTSEFDDHTFAHTLDDEEVTQMQQDSEDMRSQASDSPSSSGGMRFSYESGGPRGARIRMDQLADLFLEAGGPFSTGGGRGRTFAIGQGFQLMTNFLEEMDRSLPLNQSGMPVELDYDTLVRLSEMHNQPRGMDTEAVGALPEVPFDSTRKELSDDAKQCLICLEDFQQGEPQRWLPCLHTFHTACVDRWLSTSTTCPICKVDIEEAMASRGEPGSSSSAASG